MCIYIIIFGCLENVTDFKHALHGGLFTLGGEEGGNDEFIWTLGSDLLYQAQMVWGNIMSNFKIHQLRHPIIAAKNLFLVHCDSAVRRSTDTIWGAKKTQDKFKSVGNGKGSKSRANTHTHTPLSIYNIASGCGNMGVLVHLFPRSRSVGWRDTNVVSRTD